MKRIEKFLSNKHNIYGLMVACYVVIGTILAQHLTTPQVILAVAVIVVSNLLWYTLGMGNGIIESEMRKGHWKELLETIDEIQSKKKRKK